MPARSVESFVDIFRFIAEPDDDGVRIDHFLRDQEDVGITRSQLQKLIDDGFVTINGLETRRARKVKSGDVVVLSVPPPEPLSVEGEDIPLDIRFEDDYVLVVNKPQGLVVHPAPGHPRGTLVNAVLFGRTAKGGDPLRPGIVHRLDRNTSGLMVVAKSEEAHAVLAAQFHEHSVDRRYKALVAGAPLPKGEWRTLHGRHPTERKLFTSKVERGKVAISLFQTVERFPGAALIAVTLKTGRTHQVRVHCHDHGCPVLGDPLYGPRRLSTELQAIHEALPGQALHAELLGFVHPATGERLRFEAAPPPAFQEALAALRALCGT